MGDFSLAASVMRAVQSRGDEVTDADGAAVDLALRYAHAIDAGIEAGGQAATKALYLGPHLMKNLAELGCTPAGRAAMTRGPRGNVDPNQGQVNARAYGDENVKNDLAARRARLRGRGA